MTLEALSSKPFTDELRIDDEFAIDTETDTVTLNNTKISFSPTSKNYLGAMSNSDIYGVRHAFLDFTNFHTNHLQTLKNSYEHDLKPGAINALRRAGNQLATKLIGAPRKKQELTYVASAHTAGNYLAKGAQQAKNALRDPLQHGLAITLAHCGEELAHAAKNTYGPLTRLIEEYQ